MSNDANMPLFTPLTGPNPDIGTTNAKSVPGVTTNTNTIDAQSELVLDCLAIIEERCKGVKNTAQIVVQCSGRNTLCYNKITTCTNSSYVKVIMSLMKDKSSMKYSLQCSGRNTEAESETNC